MKGQARDATRMGIMRRASMTEYISLALSLAALAVSVITTWLTLFQRGTVRMTQPPLFYFGPANPQSDQAAGPPKIYVRTLLYCTARRGRIVENMFVQLRSGETCAAFNIWVLEQGPPVPGQVPLARGSGLYVGEDGVLGDHYFLLPPEETVFQFRPGAYAMEVYASLVGDVSPHLLFTIALTLSQQQAEQLKSSDMGIFFDWQPDARMYQAHLHRGPQVRLPPLYVDMPEARAGED
jgi:hypothetical protein